MWVSGKRLGRLERSEKAFDLALEEQDRADKDFWKLIELLHPLRLSEFTKIRTKAQQPDAARRQALRAIRQHLEFVKFNAMTNSEKLNFLFRQRGR